MLTIIHEVENVFWISRKIINFQCTIQTENHPIPKITIFQQHILIENHDRRLKFQNWPC